MNLFDTNVSTCEPTIGLFAPVQEVFSSFQGEGVYVGKRQVFVRFAHCHLKCVYCDTSMVSATGKCHVETVPGSGRVEFLENPLPSQILVNTIQTLLSTGKHHSVSFTGGEPLLYHRFLREVLPVIQPVCPTYLETSGTQPEFLREILPWVSMIAMDIKLPSATGEPPQFKNHQAFYRLAQQHPGSELFVKLIFSPHTTLEELEAVQDIVQDRTTPLILQPVTSLEDQQVYLSPEKLFWIENTLSTWFEDVRVIPQTHKMLKIL